MTRYYSPTKGYLHSDVHTEFPDDAREITEQHHAALFKAQFEGKLLTHDSNGDPIAVDRPPVKLTPEMVLASGCKVEFFYTPFLNSTYPVVGGEYDHIAALAQDVSLLGLPMGAATVKIRDTGGKFQEFDSSEIVKLYRALRDYAYNVRQGQIPVQPVVIK